LAQPTIITPPFVDSAVPSRASGPAPAPAAAIRTAFERFELKYWVSERLAEQVLAFAKPYVSADRFTLSRDSQRNTTLYLDTRGFRFCEDHVNLAPDRTKLRIRVYGTPLGKTAFFEVKRKVKTITVKDRFVLPRAEVANVLLRRPLQTCVADDSRRTYEHFVFTMNVHRAVPKLYVACFREAFESRNCGEDVRLTVDRELVYQPALHDEFAPDERRWRNIKDGEDPRTVLGRRKAMLELKFDGAAPGWMVELVRFLNLQREAYSKYTTAAQQLRARL